MHRDDPGELRGSADALFRALVDLGPQGHPGSVDVSSCDAHTPERDGDHLTLQGKLCAQRLYDMGARRTAYDQDSVVILVMTLDLVVRTLAGRQHADSPELSRLNEAWTQLQDLTLRLDRLHTAGDA